MPYGMNMLILLRPLPILSALALCLLATPPALSMGKDRCDINISNLGQIEPTDEYDPYSGGATGYHQIDLRNGKNASACTILVGIDDGSNGTRVMESSKDRLVYDLYKDSRLSQRVGDVRGSETNMFALTLDSDQSATLEFFSNIPGGQLVQKGTYSDSVTVNVYQVIDGTPFGPIATRSAQVRTKVRPVVSANVIVDGVARPLNGSVGTLELGDLTRGAAGRFDLDITGNGDYSLSLSSSNGGRLVASGGGSIPYQLYISGRAVTLSQGNTVDLGGAGRYGMQVQTDNAGQVLAGTYSDSLLLTITAN